MPRAALLTPAPAFSCLSSLLLCLSYLPPFPSPVSVLPSPLPQCISEGLCPAFQDFSSCWELPWAHPSHEGAQSMALAPIPRDQGSLSGLVYSFFPVPASCQAPLPTVGLPSPCTVSNSLHFCLLIHPLHPLGLPNPALLETSAHLPNSVLSATLHLSQPPCTSSSPLISLNFNPGLLFPTSIVLESNPFLSSPLSSALPPFCLFLIP